MGERGSPPHVAGREGAVPALELIVLGRLVDRTKGVIQGSIGRAIAPRS